MKTKICWGIVGTGDIVTRTLPDIRRVGNAEVVAVASRRQASADLFAREWNIPRAYGDYDAMLADPNIDVVYICTPQGTHFDHAKRAITAGKHVLCEKAFTLNADDARELDRRARQRGVFLMEAMWMKFSPALARVEELIASGVIGEVRNVQAGFGFPVPEVPGGLFHTAELGGGAILGLGVYPITLAHHLLGRPDRVIAAGQIRPDGVDLSETITFHYANGGLATLTNSISYFVPLVASIGGTTGTITLDAPFYAAKSLQVVQGFGVPEIIEIDTEGAGYVPMFRAVSETILAGRIEHATNPLSDTIEVLDLVDRVREILMRTASSQSENDGTDADA